MSKLKKLLYSKTGNIIISILLGLGLASLFRFSCKNNNCIIFKAPNINKNIPKSGCKINSKETIKRQTIFIKIELSLKELLTGLVNFLYLKIKPYFL